MKNTFLYFIVTFLLFRCSSDDNEGSDTFPTFSETTIQEILEAHNAYRSDVNISDISWSEELATSAQAWATELAVDCEFKHSNSDFGENIWAGTEGAFSPTDVVTSWGSEIDDYDYDSNICATDKDCGHYTQIVWEKTSKVGCGVATCDGLDIWVCQYDPPGNFIGEKPY
ncbi:pathogenesis-related family 1 protein [Reichenbachiella sp.]|uniref:pathogenesis-related family 1 protein n=1 Tax=Reichenbachiella sp. TaxID=2184521 RepID=UPI003B5CED2F